MIEWSYEADEGHWRGVEDDLTAFLSTDGRYWYYEVCCDVPATRWDTADYRTLIEGVVSTRKEAMAAAEWLMAVAIEGERRAEAEIDAAMEAWQVERAAYDATQALQPEEDEVI